MVCVPAVQCGYPDFIRIGSVLDIFLAVVDRCKRHAVLPVGIKSCNQALRIHDLLDGLHVLPVAKERARVRAAEGEKRSRASHRPLAPYGL